MYDVVIIGAGPAGSTLARLLGTSLKVLVVDKRERVDNKIAQEKCCGGLLAPDAQKMLAKLSLGLPMHILSNPQLFSVRAMDFDNHIERHYQRHYINMDRKKFDSWLISLIPKETDTLFGHALKSIKKNGRLYAIQLKHKEEIASVNAKIVVGADGAFSKVRRMMFKNAHDPKKYIAVQEWYDIKTDPAPCFYSIFDSQITDFYSWIIQKENCLALGSALDPKDAVSKKFELLKQKVAAYGIDLANPCKKSGAYLLRPQKLKDLYPGKDGVALVGEAAGFISPSSAEGLSYAMDSAYMLADSIKKGTHGFMARYRKKTIKIRCNIFLKNLKSPFMFNSFLRGLIMRSGILSLK